MREGEASDVVGVEQVVGGLVGVVGLAPALAIQVSDDPGGRSGAGREAEGVKAACDRAKVVDASEGREPALADRFEET
jgi:hypothetical protein